jgi:hypothetical protein
MSSLEEFHQKALEGVPLSIYHHETMIYSYGTPHNLLKVSDTHFASYGIQVSPIFSSIYGAAVRIRTEVSQLVDDGAEFFRTIYFYRRGNLYFARNVPVIVGEVRDLQLPRGLWPKFD